MSATTLTPSERYLAGLIAADNAAELALTSALALGATRERATEIAHDARIASLTQSCRDAIAIPVSPATLTIAIGRNVSPLPAIAALLQADAEYNRLTDKSWVGFEASVVSTVGISPDMVATGYGLWKGVGEETHVMAWYSHAPLTDSQLARLATVREYFGQESIAVTYAAPTFI